MSLRTVSTARIRIALGEELLLAVDRAARQTEQSRSSFIREALREHLWRLKVLEQEERERKGYEKHPQTEEELSPWDAVAAWPPE